MLLLLVSLFVSLATSQYSNGQYGSSSYYTPSTGYNNQQYNPSQSVGAVAQPPHRAAISPAQALPTRCYTMIRV
nr:unnamed protein product [Haemonchus contortus]